MSIDGEMMGNEKQNKQNNWRVKDSLAVTWFEPSSGQLKNLYSLNKNYASHLKKHSVYISDRVRGH